MKWKEVEPDENYPVRKFQSENAVWEWGIRQMVFGFRVTIGQCSSPVLAIPTVEVDYCCGPLDSALLWCGFVSALLWRLPETIPANVLCRLFPRQKIKPILSDPDCIKELYALSDLLREAFPAELESLQCKN